MKRHGENLNACYYMKKKPIWKGCMMYFPTTWRSGKGEIMETVKMISGCQEF